MVYEHKIAKLRCKNYVLVSHSRCKFVVYIPYAVRIQTCLDLM